MRTIALIIAVLIGAFVGASVAYWIVGLNPVPIVLGAVIGGAGLFWLCRQWGVKAFALPAALLIVFVGYNVYAAYTLGHILPPTGNRLENFDRLTAAMQVTYPYFEIKGVSWDALVREYRPQAEAAASDAEYQAVVADLLAELNDGHTDAGTGFPQPIWRFGSLRDIDGLAVVSQVDAVAQEAGLNPGDVITALNGQSVDEAINQLHPRLRVNSRPESARAWALENLLALWDADAPRTLEITVQDGDSTRTVTVTAPEDRTWRDPFDPTIRGQLLDSGIGLITIPYFYGNDRAIMVSEFDRALNDIAAATGIIIDVRGNDGGNSLTASEMAGRFIDAPFQYARESYRLRMVSRLWLPEGTRMVYPRGPLVDLPLVILTDAGTMSSAEEFVLMLADNGRAQVVGSTTAGASGNPISFPLVGGGSARFSTGDLLRVDGTRLEGVGVVPGTVVTWRLDDVRLGHDVDLEAASAIIQSLSAD